MIQLYVHHAIEMIAKNAKLYLVYTQIMKLRNACLNVEMVSKFSIMNNAMMVIQLMEMAVIQNVISNSLKSNILLELNVLMEHLLMISV